MLIRARNPDLYHGSRKKKNFFEGWYFKIVDPTEHFAFAFIPGIHRGEETGETAASHSFIQLVHGTEAFFRYCSFPVEDFRAEKNRFAVSVGDSTFSLQQMSLNLAAPSFTAEGTLTFHGVRKWPDTFLNPGSMGFYNYIPRMQCYSQVCALDMELQGTLSINGECLDFHGGRGYVEKNWGSAFPYSWIWVQSNNFSPARASLTCSLGHIPFPISSFRGFLIGFALEDDFFPFTTMNRSRCLIRQTGRDIQLTAQNARYTLTIETWTDPNQFVTLNGPRNGRMVPLVQENLLGRVRVELKDAGGGVRFAGEGRCSGIEYGGQQMLVLD